MTIAELAMDYYRELESDPDPDHDWLRWTKRPVPMSRTQSDVFVIGLVLDQGQPAERAWDKAQHLRDNFFPGGKRWWKRVAAADPRLLHAIARYGYEGKSYGENFQANKFPRWLKANAEWIEEYYAGDPRKLWAVDDTEELYDRLKELDGVGDALAKMGQFLLVRSHGVCGGWKARRKLAVKPDELLRRVLYRAGVASSPRSSAVVRAAEGLGLESPADFDAAVWLVGRKFCLKTNPRCGECPLAAACDKRI